VKPEKFGTEMLQLLKDSFTDTHRILKTIWSRGWIVFLVCAVLLEINHYYMIWVGEMYDAEWGPKVADFLAGIVASGTYILIIPLYARDVLRGTDKTRFWAHARKHVHQVAIEMLRVVAKVIIGLVLFIVPGIIWSVKLTFVPLIAQFDEQYLEGKVDALRHSEALVRGRFWAIFGLSLVFFLLSMLETYKYVFSLSSPLFYLLAAINLGLEVYVYTLFFSVYEKLVPVPATKQA
ncbi:MAG: hypothetical protein ABL958_08320, partial [Bdellovibrionia bacterium]